MGSGSLLGVPQGVLTVGRPDRSARQCRSGCTTGICRSVGLSGRFATGRTADRELHDRDAGFSGNRLFRRDFPQWNLARTPRRYVCPVHRRRHPAAARGEQSSSCRPGSGAGGTAAGWPHQPDPDHEKPHDLLVGLLSAHDPCRPLGPCVHRMVRTGAFAGHPASSRHPVGPRQGQTDSRPDSGSILHQCQRLPVARTCDRSGDRRFTIG